MSIQLNGRVVQVILAQNTGDSSSTRAELDVSGYLLSMGEASWAVDETLTKLTFGDLSLTLADDENNTVWTFIQSSLGSDSGLLPPWCYLAVDGQVVFVGIVKQSPERALEASNQEIHLSVVSWASMLETTRIPADDTAMNRRTKFRTGTGYAAGGDVTGKSVYNKELRRGHDRTMVALPSTEQNNFSAGDWVYVHNYSSFTNYNQIYPVLGAQMLNVGGLGTMWCIYLGGGFWWQENPGDNQNFGQTLTLNRVYSSTSVNTDSATLPVFTAAETWDSATAGTTPKTSLVLSYVDGLLPGDKLDKVTNVMIAGDSSYTLTIVDVDPVANVIYLDTPLTNSVTSGVTSFQINETSLGETVLEPILPLLQKATLKWGALDASAYQQASLPAPCFSFVSPASPQIGQNSHSETLANVADLQVTLEAFEATDGTSHAWVGTPTSGWDTTTWSKKVSWTDQLATAPSRVMPYVENPTDGNAGSEETRGQTNLAGMVGGKGDPNWDPNSGTVAQPVYKQVYDYTNFRRYLFKFDKVGSITRASATASEWNGSSWTGVAGLSSNFGIPVDIVSMPGTTSQVGSGNGLLALYADGSVKTIMATASLTATLPGDVLSSNGVLQAQLNQTSNGVYYSTPTGYGTIRVVSGALVCKWKQINDPSNRQGIIGLTVTPITGMVYANGVLLALAKYSYKKNISDARTTDETYLLQLTPDIVDESSGAIQADFIVSNVNRATLMVRSPISQDVFGFMGSRLFLIAKRLPNCVERFTATNQTAAAVIEFACSLTNSVAIPMPSGQLKLVSRGYNTSPTNLVLDVISSTEARWNKHLADCVVIKGFDSCQGVAVSAAQLAGLTISLTNEVWIRNSSQAKAIAQAMLAFFEKPRLEIQQEWYSDTIPAPWEGLQPMQIVTVNGGAQFYLTSLGVDYEKKTAKATLLQVV